MPQPPLLCEEGNTSHSTFLQFIHTFYDRRQSSNLRHRRRSAKRKRDSAQPQEVDRRYSTQGAIFCSRLRCSRNQFGPLVFSRSATFATPAFAQASSCSWVEPELPTAPITSFPI